MSSVEPIGAKRRTALRIWSSITHRLSCEWLLNHRPNGGAIILLRTIIISFVAYILILTFTQVIDPDRTWTPNPREAKIAIRDTISWFGAIFAAVYVSLYTRFASQWLYLANLYNQIMASEVRAASLDEKRKVLDEWKAGFLHDACDLHLARKPLFLSLVRRWGQEPYVRDSFVLTTPGGDEAHRALMRSVGIDAAAAPGVQVAPPS